MTVPKIERITKAISHINLAIPGVTSIIVSLKNGSRVDLQSVLDDTDKRMEEIIKQGEDFLARTE